MDYLTFVRSAERGELAPVVLMHGGDPQLLDDALALATRRLFADASLAVVGREVVDARETAAEEIVRSAMTLPLMTPRRLVAVRRAEMLAAKAEPLVREYAARPNPATCLLLLAEESLEGGRDGKVHWLLRAVPASSVVTVPVRRGRALEEWLRQRAAAEGLTVSEEAARLLVEWVGDDTAALLGEVRKAALAGASGGSQVGVNEVTAVVGEHRLSGVFDLVRAVERRDVGLALRLLDRLLTAEEPMRLLALLVGEVRLGWSVAELASRGQSAGEIARALRKPQGVIVGRLGAGAREPDGRRGLKLHRCWDVERRLKSGGDGRTELAALLVELCR